MNQKSIYLTDNQLEEVEGEIDSVIGLMRAAKKTIAIGENPHLATLLELGNLTLQNLVLEHCEIKEDERG
jgi:hypothetical protein